MPRHFGSVTKTGYTTTKDWDFTWMSAGCGLTMPLSSQCSPNSKRRSTIWQHWKQERSLTPTKTAWSVTTGCEIPNSPPPQNSNKPSSIPSKKSKPSPKKSIAAKYIPPTPPNLPISFPSALADLPLVLNLSPKH